MKLLAALFAICLFAIQTVKANVYYNNKTFTGTETISEKVYIGAKEAEGVLRLRQMHWLQLQMVQLG